VRDASPYQPISKRRGCGNAAAAVDRRCSRPRSGIPELLPKKSTGRPRRPQNSGRKADAVRAPHGPSRADARGPLTTARPLASAWRGLLARCARTLRLGAERTSPSARLPLMVARKPLEPTART